LATRKPQGRIIYKIVTPKWATREFKPPSSPFGCHGNKVRVKPPVNQVSPKHNHHIHSKEFPTVFFKIVQPCVRSHLSMAHKHQQVSHVLSRS